MDAAHSLVPDYLNVLHEHLLGFLHLFPAAFETPGELSLRGYVPYNETHVHFGSALWNGTGLYLMVPNSGCELLVLDDNLPKRKRYAPYLLKRSKGAAPDSLEFTYLLPPTHSWSVTVASASIMMDVGKLLQIEQVLVDEVSGE